MKERTVNQVLMIYRILEMKQYDRVCVEINLDAICNNADEFHRICTPECKILAVIKADGYGMGAYPIAQILQEKEYIYGFATATAEEALALRHMGIKKEILIIGYTFPYAYEELIKENISLTVFRKDTLDELNSVAKNVNKKACVHVKVDTGMRRIGIEPNQAGTEYVKSILTYENLSLKGIFTHLATADEEDTSKAAEQIEVFKRFVLSTESEMNFRIPIRHCSNSAGILAFDDANLDVVRLGIALYGIMPSDQTPTKGTNLQSVLTLRSKIIYIKDVEKGQPISYGGTFITRQPMKVATIPVGYGDGYPRALSNCGYVYIRRQKAPILGRICMDQFMVDVSDIDGAEEGDTVTLIGSDGNNEITVENLCDIYGGFRYELTCNLSKRIPRVYYAHGKQVYDKDYIDE